MLHRRQHRDQGRLDLLVEAHLPRLLEHRLQLEAQLQGHVGVLHRVLRQLLKRHLAHAALVLAALADQVGDGHRPVPEQGLGEVVEGAAQVGHGEEGGHHRVEEAALHLDALPAQGDEVELEVVADLGHRRVLQQRAQLLEDGAALLLVLREGDVGPRVRRVAHRQAEELAGARVEARRLQVEGEGAGLLQLGDQRGAAGGVLDGPVVVLHVGDGAHLVGVLDAGVEALHPGLEVVAEEALAEGVELQLREQAGEGLVVSRSPLEGFDLQLHGHVGLDRHQPLGEPRLVGVLLKDLAALALDLLDAVEELLHGAEVGQQLLGRLLADAGHAGHVVDGVAHEPEEVGDLLDALDLPLGQHVVLAEQLRRPAGAARAVEQGPLRHELGEVLVGGDHVGRHARRLGPAHEGADHVVGLPAVDAHHGDVEPLEDAEDVGHGRAQVLGHALALGLVLGELLVPVGRLAGVEDGGQVGRLEALQKLQQGVGEDEGRRGVHPPGVGHRVVDQREVGAVGQGQAVEEAEDAAVLEVELAAAAEGAAGGVGGGGGGRHGEHPT